MTTGVVGRPLERPPSITLPRNYIFTSQRYGKPAHFATEAGRTHEKPKDGGMASAALANVFWYDQFTPVPARRSVNRPMRFLSKCPKRMMGL